MKKKNTFLQWLPFILVILVSFSATSQTTVVELENGTLLNGASIQNCSTCSNTMVGNLGGSSNGGVSIVVNLEKAGSYSLKLFYCTGDPRTIYITSNAENHLVVPCSASGGWTTVANKSVILNLKAGTNTITFDNSDNWGPNLDEIELTALTTSNIQSISFGENNHIDYDLNNGFYDIYFGEEKIIDHAALLMLPAIRLIRVQIIKMQPILPHHLLMISDQELGILLHYQQVVSSICNRYFIPIMILITWLPR